MSQESQSELPLAGVRVLDLSLTLPGPYASYLLMQLGARVTRVVPPWGDPAQEFLPALDWIHEGKETLRLNLKYDDGRKVVLTEAKTSDVVLEGFRPGVAARLGVDAGAIAKVNDRVIYCSLSGYGQTGSLHSAPGHDANYQSLAGVVDLMSTGRGLELGVHPTAPLSDLAMSVFAVVSILAGLRHRDQVGRGSYVDIAAADSIVSLLGPYIHARGFGRILTPELPSYGAFQARDGHWLTLGVIYEQHFWTRLVSDFNLPPEWADLDVSQRALSLDEIRPEIAARIGSMTREECLARLTASDIPAMGVQTPREVLFGPHFQERGVVRVNGDRRDIGLPFILQDLDYLVSTADDHSNATRERTG